MAKTRYLKQTFTARELPEVILLPPADYGSLVDDGTVIVGPFCVHCGNPFSLHSPTLRCPAAHLHPLFPPPSLPFAPVP